MSFAFPIFLVVCTFFTGIIYLLDVIWWSKIRKRKNIQMPIFIDYMRSFFPVFLVVLLIRSFLFQPFRVPTGSLEPTILPGEFLVVKQYSYGLKLPVIHTKVFSVSEPKRGDIAVFRFPGNPHVDYIKRVIGLPGDHVLYKNKRLYINGKAVTQTYLGKGFDIEPNGMIPANLIEENLFGVKHKIITHIKKGETLTVDVTVPQNHYFMMGDNRDNSGDSRFWGFVPEKNLVGKAAFIWFSWDGLKHRVRWDRIGTLLD